MQAVQIGPVPAGERTQSPFDLFLIFAGTNIVAATLQVGATLASAFRVGNALVLIALGIVAGGPRAVVLADCYAVPLLAVVGVLLTITCLCAFCAVRPPASSLRFP